MSTIKSAALTFIAIVAYLMLLLVPDSSREPAPTGDKLPLRHQFPLVSQPQIAFQIEQAPVTTGNEPTQVEPARSESPAFSEDTIRADDWPRILYPELSRIEALENLPVNDALIELIPMLSSDDPVIRFATIESIGDINNPHSAAVLVAASGDPNPQLRVVAIEALAAQEDATFASSIEPHLYDPEREVRLAAIDAISELVSEGSVYALAGLLSDPDPRIRQRVVDALGEIGGESAMLYLEQARYDPSQSIRTDVESILSELAWDLAN